MVSKERASGKQRDENGTRERAAVILGLSSEGFRVESPKPGKTPNKVTGPFEGFIVEVNPVALWKRLAKQRRETKSRPGKQDEFVTLWRRGLRLRARLRRVLKHPEAVRSHAELRRDVLDAVEVGIICERLVWKFGGIAGESAKFIKSRFQSDEGLAEAKKTNKAGLTEGLKHKFELMCKHDPTISRPAIARRFLKESKEDSRRCHDCQCSKWVRDSRGELPREPRDRCKHHGKCLECEECTMWHARLSEWRNRTRERLKKKELTEEDMDKRIVEALAKRIGDIDSRASRRRRTTRGRRGVVRG